jgi:hypothetical protein
MASIASPRIALASSKLEREEKRFAHELVHNMAEVQGGSDVAAQIVERLMSAMREKSEAYAAATAKPRMPAWAINVMVGIGCTTIMTVAGGLVAWGTLTNRVANLENSHPEALAALTVELHDMNDRLKVIEAWVNESRDERPARRPVR